MTSDESFHGMSRSRLRLQDVERPFHGVSAIELGSADVFARCRSYLPLMRANHFFSHVTAAMLHCIPLPDELMSDPRVHVAVVGSGTRPRRRGVVGHELADHIPVTLREELPVVSPADAWFQLAPMLSRTDLVAAGDFVLTGQRINGVRQPLCTRAELESAFTRYAAKRGMRTAAWALPRLRNPVDSRPETLTRLALVAAGYPEPRVNDPTVVDGGVALHPDLKWPDLRIVFEYEGDGHRTDKKRFRDDIRRKELFESAGWRVIRVTAYDIFADPDGFLRRVEAVRRQQERLLGVTLAR